MSKHIIVSEDTHKQFKQMAKDKGMKFDAFLKLALKDHARQEMMLGN